MSATHAATSVRNAWLVAYLSNNQHILEPRQRRLIALAATDRLDAILTKVAFEARDRIYVHASGSSAQR